MEHEQTPQSPTVWETLTALFEGPAARIVTFVVIPLLLLLALWLPPISIFDRLLDRGYAEIPAGASLNDPDGTQVVVESAQSPLKARMASIPRVEFLEGNIPLADEELQQEMAMALQALPPQVDVRSPVYVFDTRNADEADVRLRLAIPIPNPLQ